MRIQLFIVASVFIAIATGCMTHETMGNAGEKLDMSTFYLPNAEASSIVEVTSKTNGPIGATVYVQTHAVSVKENASKGSAREIWRSLRVLAQFFRRAQR